MSNFTIHDNGQPGLMRGLSIEIGGKPFDIQVLNVEASRKAWVPAQRWFLGAAAAAGLNQELETAGAPERANAIDMVSHIGHMEERDMDALTKLFAERTSFTRVVDSTQGQRTDRLFLKDAGAMDAAFGGDFGLFLEWLHVCVLLNFGSQIEKRVAVLEAKARLDAAKAKPTNAGS